MNRFRGVLAALAVLAVVAAACGGDGDDGGGGGTAAGGGGDGGGGDRITIALGSEPTTLDPQARDDGGERAVNDNIYETLVSRDREGALQPLLATAMPTQVDATTWEVKLQEGITFQNGNPFNADTAAFSIERIIDPEFNSEQSSFFEGITGAEAVDPTTVRITTEGPDPVFPARLVTIKMVDPEEAGQDDFAENPVGTGPYTFVQWDRGQQVMLEANEDYWGDAPSIPNVTYKFVEEPGTRLSGLTAGDFDIIQNLLPEDVDRAPKAARVVGIEHPVMVLNTMEGPTADPQVREAMNLAVDKEAIVNDLYGGLATVDNCQTQSPSFFGYNESLEPKPYDPERAKQLIEDAGAAGQTVQIISTSGRWLKDRELTEAVANYWTEAGLQVDVQFFELSEYLDRIFDRSNRPSTYFVSSGNELLDASRQMAAYVDMEGVGASNDDAELTALVRQAAVETDEAARLELYQQITQEVCDESLYAFLINVEDTYGLSERVNWEPRVDAKILVSEMELSGS